MMLRTLAKGFPVLLLVPVLVLVPPDKSDAAAVWIARVRGGASITRL